MFRRYLAAKARHALIRDVEVRAREMLQGVSARSLRAHLRGRRFDAARRHGKYLFAGGDRGGWLVLPGHLKYFRGAHRFLNSNLTLLPVKAIAAGNPSLLSPTEHERGERLFVAKGCLTCHRHDEVQGSGHLSRGPILTTKQYQGDYLTRFLADPAMARSGRTTTWEMPELNLTEQEIIALVAFINRDSQVRIAR